MAKRRFRRAAARTGAVAKRGGRKVRSNYRKHGGKLALLPDLKDGAYAIGGGASFPIIMKLLNKFLPVGADGTSSIPRPLLALLAAMVAHVGGTLALGSRAVGLGALGAAGADICVSMNVPGMLGISDYLGMNDYFGDRMGAQSVQLLGRAGIQTPAFQLGDILSHRRHLHRVGDTSTAYGQNYGAEYGGG